MKNKIITLSGQPVAGKSSTTKKIVEKLKNHYGYTDENIHIISTGEQFRNYMLAIIELINNINSVNNYNDITSISNQDILKNLMQNQEFRNIVIKAATQLKKDNQIISTSDISLANSLSELSEVRNYIDTLLDTSTKKIGESINKENHENEIWIFDSRLAFYTIPEAFSIRLVCDSDVAGKRTFERQSKTEKYSSIEEATKARNNRMESEKKRYKEKYNVDLEDESNYDLVLDTTYSKPEDAADVVCSCFDLYMKDEPFASKWVSPKTLLPLQSERDTIGSMFCSFEEVENNIANKGFDPKEPISVVEVDGKKYIIEGHHRNFASAHLGKTFVPIDIIAKNDEKISEVSHNTARQRANSLKPAFLYGHEGFFDKNFSYENIYPGIYKEAEKNDIYR